MPYEVARDEQACSTTKPFAVRNSQTGRVMGCHPTRDDANQQLRALQANVPDMNTIIRQQARRGGA